MSGEVDPRLVAAIRKQLSRRPAGAERVGWKVGSDEHEQIGGDHIVGNLTPPLAPGSTYDGGGEPLQADVEVAIEVGEAGEPRRFAVALELCDRVQYPTIEQLVAGNDHHLAVAFGPFSESLPEELEGVLVVDGERRAAGAAAANVTQRLEGVGRVLESVGERLEAGDRVITGLIVDTIVAPGAEVVAHLGELGSVMLRVA